MSKPIRQRVLCGSGASSPDFAKSMLPKVVRFHFFAQRVQWFEPILAIDMFFGRLEIHAAIRLQELTQIFIFSCPLNVVVGICKGNGANVWDIMFRLFQKVPS